MKRKEKRPLKARLLLTRRLTGWLLLAAILLTTVGALLGTPLPAAVQKLVQISQARREEQRREQAEAEAYAAAAAAEEAARKAKEAFVLGGPFSGTYPALTEARQDAVSHTLETEEQAWDLFDRLMHPEEQSFEDYSRLFYQVPEEEIRRYYGGELAAQYRPYTERNLVNFMSTSQYCYLEYAVSGEGRPIDTFTLCARYSNGRFYFTHGDAAELVLVGEAKYEKGIDILGEPYVLFLAAKAGGKNAAQLRNPAEAAQGSLRDHWTMSPLYLYQRETGEVVVGLFVSNGTGYSIPLNRVTLTLTDGDQTISRYTAQASLSIPKNERRLVELVIPADRIATGLAPWSEDIDCDCDVAR